MTCTYRFNGPDGESITIIGKPALKAYLASGGLQFLLPDRQAPAFRRTPIQAAIAAPQVEMVTRMATGIAARWANPPEVVVFTDMQDPRIPQDVRDEDARQKAGGAKGEPEGFYYQGVTYLNAAQISTPQDAARVLFHEGLGHYGLRGVFGKALKSELEQIVALRKADVLAKAKEYGFDTQNPAALLKAAEEVLASMAQTTPTIGFVKRAIAAIRTWLRTNVPGLANLELSDAEIIRDYILPARAFVERGAQAGKDMVAAAAFSRTDAFKRWFGDSKVVDAQGKPLVAYHVTSADFSIFDVSKSKRAAFGAGFYFATNPNSKKMQGTVEGSTFMPVYLSIKRPASLADVRSAMDEIGFGNYSYDQQVERGKAITENLKSKGFDGADIDGDWLAFDPGQIKSATGNNGNYDTTNPDIRFSRSTSSMVDIDSLPAETKDDIAYTLHTRVEAFDRYRSEDEVKQEVFGLVDPVVVSMSLVDVSSIDASARSRAQTAVDEYAKRDGKSAPPILLDGNKLIEGGHRYFAAVKRGDKTIKAIDVGPLLRADWGNWLDGGEKQPSDPVRSNVEEVRFSRSKSPSPTGLTPPEQGFLRKTQAEFQDNNNRIKQVQETIAGITGEKVPEYADYYLAETNRPGRIAARLQDFRDKMRAPLVQRIAKSGHTLDQVEELAHAMHALERNRAVAKINPKHDPASKEFIGVEGSGMNSDKAVDIMDKYKADTALQKHVKDLQAIARATLDIKLASGRLARDQYDAYTNAYDFYVPLKGDGEYGPDVKRAMGHEARDEQVLENVMRDYEQAVVTAEKNLARQSLLQLVLQNLDSKLWTIGVTPKGRYVAGQVFTIMKDGEEVAIFTSQAQVDAFMEAKGPQASAFEVLDERGERVKEFAKPLQANEVPVYIDGQRVRIQIKDEALAGQLRPMDQKQMNWVLATFSNVQRHLSRIYTAYSPTFIITNPLRDVQTGSVNMLGNQGAGVTLKAWTKYPGALKALAEYAASGKEPNTETGKMLKEYRMNGGKTGASHMSDLEEQGNTLQRLFDDAYGAKGYLADGKVGKAAWIAGRKMLMGMAHVIEVTNQATENALRLSLYMTLRNSGSTPGEAAQAAKNVTVNFDRKGNQTGVMGAMYLFFNPAVQGTANALKTLAKGEHKKQAWAALGALGLLGMWAAGQGIDDDEDRWLGEDWDIRSKKLVMNIGGKKITVPLSLEFAPFFAAGVALEEARRGAVSKTEATGRLLSSFIEAYVPFKGLYSFDSDNKPIDAVTAAIPTVLRPAMEAATNRNAFGSKIVPESDFTKDRADNLKMSRNTKGTMFDSAAQGLAAAGEAMGAGRYENDISKVSPETLKHWWRTYTGGLGTFIADMGSLGKMAAQDASAIEMADVPVLKSFAKGQDVGPIRGRFYELTKDARAAAAEFKQAKDAGDGESIDAILANPSKAELLGLDRLIRNTTKSAAALRDEMVDINADTTMGLSEKRAKLKELEKEEEALYRDAIAAFR